jgi:hypothetical protein
MHVAATPAPAPLELPELVAVPDALPELPPEALPELAEPPAEPIPLAVAVAVEVPPVVDVPPPEAVDVPPLLAVLEALPELAETLEPEPLPPPVVNAPPVEALPPLPPLPPLALLALLPVSKVDDVEFPQAHTPRTRTSDPALTIALRRGSDVRSFMTPSGGEQARWASLLVDP